ncbi:MAG: thioredoxin-disulfide reductase [Oscillospiraceae bacterium]|nr:thioredoxin-disulfide reductase [Oscillospiraceae bacterium]
MDQIYDVIIVGGGPGGYSAALYCARAGLHTLVLEKLSAGGQMASTAQVDNYPGFDEGVAGFELGEKMQRGAERFGAVTEYRTVTALHMAEQPKRIETAGGEYLAKAVIYAAGASPRALGLPGEAALRTRGVSYCATCDGMFYRGKTVAVAGGGNTAVADALELAGLCKTVFLIHHRDSLRADPVYLEPLQKARNVKILWNTVIDDVLTENGAFRGLSLTDKPTGEKRELPCDGLFVAVGQVPDTALLQGQAELDKTGYLVADETTRTSVPGLFAVGDVRTKPLRQIVTAAADGAVAAKFAAEYLLGL